MAGLARLAEPRAWPREPTRAVPMPNGRDKGPTRRKGDLFNRRKGVARRPVGGDCWGDHPVHHFFWFYQFLALALAWSVLPQLKALGLWFRYPGLPLGTSPGLGYGPERHSAAGKVEISLPSLAAAMRTMWWIRFGLGETHPTSNG